jgi:hypothetical protein
MAKTKYLKGECQHCSGSLEFPAESIGLTATCPHCGKETELQLATPPIQPTVPRRIIVWTLLAIVLLVGGLIVSVAGLKHYQKQLAERKKQAVAPATAPAQALEDPFASQGFKTSAVQLEKTSGSSLVYATGTVANQTDHQRFGVRVELDVLDGAGRRIGSAKDYQAVLDPKAEWRFKALVIGSNAVSAKIGALTEDKGH